MSETNPDLSEREQEILRLVATGASNKEIARQLYISANTVKVHLRNVYAKINVVSRTEAAMYAIENGIVKSPAPELEPVTVLVEKPAEPGRWLMLWQRFWWAIILLGFATIIGLAVVIGRSSIFASQPAEGSAAMAESQRWQELAPLPVARAGLAAVAYEDQVYVIGGETEQGITARLDKYDPSSDTWESLKAKPTAVKEISAAVLGGRIFVPGGRLESGALTDVMEIYNPRLDSWEAGTTMPTSLSGYALAVFEGKLYLFGGWEGDSVSKLVYEYDPNIEQWHELPGLPTGRSLAGAGVVGRKIFVFGGYDGEKASRVNEVFYPDLVEDRMNVWQQASELPEGLYGMGATSIADIVYAVGGEGELNRKYPMLAYFSQSNDWQTFNISVATLGSHLALVNLGTKLIALGGESDGILSSQNQSFAVIYTMSVPMIIK